MECSCEPSFINFLNFGGDGDAFFRSSMPFIRQDYSCIHLGVEQLINPIKKKKKETLNR
jgi:hypothetical protein